MTAPMTLSDAQIELIAERVADRIATRSPVRDDPWTRGREEFRDLLAEIAELSSAIHSAKAAMMPLGADPALRDSAGQLAAVMETTEGAANQILAATEELQEILSGIGAGRTPGSAEIVPPLNHVLEQIVAACAFQDLSSQRITKVLGLLTRVESHIDTVLDLLELKGVPVQRPPAPTPAPEGDGLMNGPTENPGQDEIDKLFDSL